MIEATILAFVPISIFVFILIVAFKIICFYFAEQSYRNRKKKRNFNQFQNEDEEDPAEIEAVVSIYYRAMEQVKYVAYPDNENGQKDVRNI